MTIRDYIQNQVFARRAKDKGSLVIYDSERRDDHRCCHGGMKPVIGAGGDLARVAGLEIREKLRSFPTGRHVGLWESGDMSCPLPTNFVVFEYLERLGNIL
jgi:hypothetical protein